MKKHNRIVAYKETEIFELFPKLSYTPAQRKRVTLFHAYAKGYRKIINYAAKFDEPNNICLVYVVGELKDGAVEQAINNAGCSDRVCVITASFPDEKMKIWSDYDDLRKRYGHSGLWDEKTDAPKEELLREKKKLRDYYADYMKGGVGGQMSLLGLAEDYDLCEREVAEYDSMIGVIKRYDKLKAQCGTAYFKNFRLHRAGHKEKPYTHDDLDKLIKRIFPLGAEALGVNSYAFLSPASVAAAVSWARDGTDNKKLALTEEMISPAAKALIWLIAKRIADHGFCTLSEMAHFIQCPPFGMGYDGYSAACVTKALVHFSNRTMLFFDGCGHFEEEGMEDTVFFLMLAPLARARRNRRDKACLYLEASPHKKVKQFMSKLWGIKIRMPGALMGLYLARDLCGSHKVPLAYIDERLLNLTLWNVDFWDKAQVQALADEIETHGADILAAYGRYLEANDNIPEKAQSLMKVDYSWAWSKDEYADILWQTEKYGAWPWDTETHNKVRKETQERSKAKAHGETQVCMV